MMSESSSSEASHGTKKEERLTNVYIWDMDETLILLKSLLDGTYAKQFKGSKDVSKGTDLGKAWEKSILQVSDDYLFYEQIENHNQPFLDVMREYDDGRDLSNYDFHSDGYEAPSDELNKRKLSYRLRRIAQKYTQGLPHVLDDKMIETWNYLYEMTDSFTDRWFSSGVEFLKQLSGGNASTPPNDNNFHNINVLVTSGSLIPSLAKCLLFRLDGVFSHDNVYSSWEVGKLQCFSWIKERFDGPKTRFCVIGDGMEECASAERMKWPFIQIDFRPDGVHRFPGLTARMVDIYVGIIYGPDKDDE